MWSAENCQVENLIGGWKISTRKLQFETHAADCTIIGSHWKAFSLTATSRLYIDHPLPTLQLFLPYAQPNHPSVFTMAYSQSTCVLLTIFGLTNQACIIGLHSPVYHPIRKLTFCSRLSSKCGPGGVTEFSTSNCQSTREKSCSWSITWPCATKLIDWLQI